MEGDAALHAIGETHASTSDDADLDSYARTFAVIECFGPTVQGEGALAGAPTLFVRFGGCDYRCEWCDSMYAVDPDLVRENARKLTGAQIADELRALIPHPMWVTFSGGNPALQRLGRVVVNLQMLRYKIAVETQGSIWREWLSLVDHLTVSPKPPSSGMVSGHNADQTARFMAEAEKLPRAQRSLKIVVFDEADLAWARDFIMDRRGHDGEWDTYLSAGTDVPNFDTSGLAIESLDETRRKIGERYRWLCESIAVDPLLSDVRVLPQLHVIAFGHARAV